MDVIQLNRIVLVVCAVLYYVLALALPTWRIRRQTGQSAFTFARIAAPIERTIGRAMSVAFVLVPTWILLYAGFGPDALGVWRTPVWVTVLGWGCVALGITLVVVAQTTMGESFRIGIAPEQTELVTRRLYRLVRHPIFLGIGVTVVGLVMASPCGWTIMGALNLWTLLSIQARIEEQHLLAINGAVYADYMRRVGRFIPKPIVFRAQVRHPR